MKNHVKTKTDLSDRNEDMCVDIFRNIMRSRHIMQEKASSVAAGADLHAAELNVVDMLGKFGPISMGRLAKEAFISPSNTTSTVKKLERADLVTRKRSTDSDREVTVGLSSKGRAVFRRCYPRVLRDVHEHLRSRLTNKEIIEFQKTLAKIVT